MKKLLNFIAFFLVTTAFFSQTLPPSYATYYDGVNLNAAGEVMFLELASKITSTHVGIPYTGSPVDVWDACKLADEDPDNPSNVLLIYGYNDNDGLVSTDRTRSKGLQDTGSGASGVWNREHVFAQSLAVPSFGTNEPGPGTDVHNLRPADRDRNTSRSNRFFTSGSGTASYIAPNGEWYPGDEWKGDIARIVMYMYTRYHGNGYQISETKCLPINIGVGNVNTMDPNMIDLFLQWNVEDPVSTFEANRNEVLAGIQGNRNPFIDNPYLATLIWGGTAANDTWDMGNLSDAESPTKPTNLQATNITFESLELNWDASTDNVGVYDYLIYLNGVYLKSATSNSTTITKLNPETTYVITIKARDARSNLSEISSSVIATTLVGPKILLFDDFEDCANSKFVSVSEASNKNWLCESTYLYGENNSKSVFMNGYQEDVPSKDWLITKAPINFDVEKDEKLSFYAKEKYGITPLEVLYSSDYDGGNTPGYFTWTAIPNIVIPVPVNNTPNDVYEIYNITNIDVSSITGTVYIAFKYYSDGVDPTRWIVDNFKITADNNPDLDGDGVANEDDLCPNTPLGAGVDANGCSNGQLDDDNDGVQNSDDLCPSTPTGEQVNATGCAESQLDDDLDGVMNNVDTCQNTPSGAMVDANGCSNGQLDDDNDGVQNSDDLCANTPTGEQVNAAGCSESQLDDDLDSVMNNVDMCPNTPSGEAVDANGCSESQLDDDNDGVKNNVDQCSNTPAGTTVNAVGCFTLNANNFKVETIGETCPNKNNGKLKITTVKNLNYKVTIKGTAYSFTNSLEVENLAAGAVDFCILVDGETYEQCYAVTIEAGKTIAGKASVTSNKVAINMSQGTAPFNILVNGQSVFETHNTSFSVDVVHGDLVQVKTKLDCEGVFSKQIDLFESFIAYPNPTKGLIEIGLPIAQKKVTIELYNMQSQLILSKSYDVNFGKVQLNMEALPTGLYLAKVVLEKPVSIKIVKQ